ncbi:hypothetical protein J2Z31_002914 [Sinorhizobium kostiense]|uniref:Uncharacterized protein n=1 Tax=Sinorhizobium kostiense TaxID=76747 RepID=A0ABS4R290_9HYPH|nr:hypothetical protein [Sinorhizobium kostiense]
MRVTAMADPALDTAALVERAEVRNGSLFPVSSVGRGWDFGPEIIGRNGVIADFHDVRIGGW